MRIAITGSSGLIGSAVAKYFREDGHYISRISRPSSAVQMDDAVVTWDIPSQTADISGMENHDVVIHLAGAGIADKRWNAEYKKTILDSRLHSTQFLCKILSGLKHPPKVLFCASAIGYYGNHSPDEALDETSPKGSGFLAQVCQYWEEAAEPARVAGIRVVHMRFGIVLDAKKGALGKMLPIFKLGLGGRVGTGEQMMSWIVADEIPRMIDYLIRTENISGPVNFVSPDPVDNIGFAKTLGGMIGRPTFLPLPERAVKLAFGEMGETLLLGGAKVLPKVLTDHGYPFAYPEIVQALKHCLK